MKQKTWRDCAEFHGHECGGLTIGYKAAHYAIKLLDIGRAEDDGAAAAALHGFYRIFDTAQGQPAPGLERSSHRTCPSPAAQPPPWAPENRTSSAREKLSLRNSPPQSAARA